jgi:hypothetical protein
MCVYGYVHTKFNVPVAVATTVVVVKRDRKQS